MNLTTYPLHVQSPVMGINHALTMVGVTGFEPATSSSRTTSTFVLSVNQAWDSLKPDSKTAFNLFFAARSRHVFLYSPRALNPYVGLR